MCSLHLVLWPGQVWLLVGWLSNEVCPCGAQDYQSFDQEDGNFIALIGGVSLIFFVCCCCACCMKKDKDGDDANTQTAMVVLSGPTQTSTQQRQVPIRSTFPQTCPGLYNTSLQQYVVGTLSNTDNLCVDLQGHVRGNSVTGHSSYRNNSDTHDNSRDALLSRDSVVSQCSPDTSTHNTCNDQANLNKSCPNTVLNETHKEEQTSPLMENFSAAIYMPD